MLSLILIIKIVILILAILLVAYFSATETALLSLSSENLAKLKLKISEKTKILDLWEQEPNSVLASIILGIHLSQIATGVISASVIIYFSQYHSIYRWLIIPLSTIIILLCGELFPKVYARYNSEKVSLFSINFLEKYIDFILPVSNLTIKISEKILNLFGVAKTIEKPFLDMNELKLLLSSPEVYNGLGNGHKMLRNVLSFVDQKVSEVMLPRSEIFAVNYEQPLDKIINQIISSKFSRIPIYQNTLDNIIGIIYTKDIIMMSHDNKLFVLSDLIRPAYFVLRNISLNNLLREFKQGHQHMAIVVDEYGTTVGLITIEDIIEEIVGEIYDEYDVKEKKIVNMPDNTWVILGDETVKNVNEQLGLNLFHPGVVTISGLISTKLGRIPLTGEFIELGNVIIEVIDSDRKKIKKIKLIKKINLK